MKRALILVDLQNDFMPGGALAVEEGNKIIPVVNKLLKLPFDVIVATKDWHPENHCSFVTSYKDKSVGDHVSVRGIDQILWPKHCVQNTRGAEFKSGWNHGLIDKEVHKGTEKDIDSYSTFFDNEMKRETGLNEYLKEKGITDVYIAGLATDYCVKYSVLDAIDLGFRTHVVVDGCRGVNLDPQDSQEALKIMEQAGAELMSFKDVEKKLI